MLNSRKFFILLFLISTSLLIYGFYLEYARGLEPCPLCILQQIAYMGIILISLVAALHNPKGLLQVIYKILITLTSMAGTVIAGRQTWLQHLPPELVPECGLGLDYMLNVFPIGEAIKMIITGSGECAEVKWNFIGLSIAEWSLIMFFGITTITIISILQNRHQP